MKFIITIFSLFSFIGCNQAKNQTTEKDTSKKVKRSNMNTHLEVATFGGGCYWCIEAVFQRLEGVEKVESGFSGGQVKNPTYKEVCTGTTGHAEVIQITFDTTKTSFEEILKVFFTMHDPTTLNRQGNDIGTQYRSAVFYHNDEQKKAAEEIIAALNTSKAYPNPIVTEVSKLDVFYKAEDYHQNYYNENSDEGYCRFVIQPKIEKFEKVFKDRLKK
ncbi:MAG TPA: peptide-methionine (S)-S-oxide reductase MsrA [Chitinophagales bacterium]|jgi:methionine-S-sulfoxide reductase|nr:peptide-methionine (S)-S-oxide reductase MsrA [Saprospirales bacterium]HOY40507.1 peptide-methionine (S)-S-oxide reductase MsrA [Chitinophagales bacterium]HPN18098.1 peptide-methionine (S)-S-oxide reductase MsrA [Chitinophagales bacterium]